MPEKERTEQVKAMTLRLPQQTAKDLEAVADVDQISVAEAARTAIEDHIQQRRKDKEFVERLRRSLEENREILERLAQ
jgi:hypothetical protein